MSLAHFISLQNKAPGFDTFVNGKAVAHECEALEALALEMGVTPIMQFYGKKWHHPDKGLETVHALLKGVADNPSSVKDPEYVREDLKQWEEVLLKAKEANIKWKMKIDY
jgi:hypothetical protein